MSKGYKTNQLCEEIQEQRKNSEKKIIVQDIQDYMKDKFGNEKVLPSHVMEEMAEIVISRDRFFAHVQDEITALGIISVLSMQKDIYLDKVQIEFALEKYKYNTYNRTNIIWKEIEEILEEVQKMKEK